MYAYGRRAAGQIFYFPLGVNKVIPVLSYPKHPSMSQWEPASLVSRSADTTGHLPFAPAFSLDGTDGPKWQTDPDLERLKNSGVPFF